MPCLAACSLSRRCTSSGTWRIWIIRVFMRDSIGACVAHAPEGFRVLPTAPTCGSGAGKADAETLGGELEDDLAGGHEVGDAGGSQAFQVGQAVGVGPGAGAAGGVEEAGVGPDLGPGLAEEAPGGQAVEGLEEAVGAAAGAAQGLQLGVLGADPGHQDLVDVLVVGVAAGQQLGVVEVARGDHGQERLGEVVVDVGVHAEQDVAQGRQAVRTSAGPEGDRPRFGRAPAGLGVLDGVQLEVGEGDVPALDPGRVAEPAPLQLLGHRPGGAQVGGEEEAGWVVARLQRLQQPLHPAHQRADAGRALHGGKPASGPGPRPACQATRPGCGGRDPGRRLPAWRCSSPARAGSSAAPSCPSSPAGATRSGPPPATPSATGARPAPSPAVSTWTTRPAWPRPSRGSRSPTTWSTPWPRRAPSPAATCTTPAPSGGRPGRPGSTGWSTCRGWATSARGSASTWPAAGRSRTRSPRPAPT